MEANEGDLAAYYDQEVADRAARKLDGQRVQARERFIDSLGGLAHLKVLEIGPGAGLDAAALVASGARAFGVDLSFAQARRQSGVSGLCPVVGSVSRLPVTSRAVDVVWTMSVLMHIPDSQIDSALGEVRRVLRPGGLAVIGVWGGSDIEEPRLEDPYRPARLFSRRSDARWRHLLTTIGRVVTYESGGLPAAGITNGRSSSEPTRPKLANDARERGHFEVSDGVPKCSARCSDLCRHCGRCGVG